MPGKESKKELLNSRNGDTITKERGMKYAIFILVVLFFMCLYMAYRVGLSDCRTTRAEVQLKIQQVAVQNDRKIQQMVMSIPDDANLAWLLSEHKRAD